MTAIGDFIGSLKRASAPPGEFATYYPEAIDAELEEHLLDAFGEAQLHGFLSGHSADDAGEVSPDLTRAQGALVVLFGARTLLQSKLANLKSHVRYEAGTAVFEESTAASVLTDLLKSHDARLAAILEQAQLGNYEGAFWMVDQYLKRASSTGSIYDYHPAEVM